MKPKAGRKGSRSRKKHGDKAPWADRLVAAFGLLLLAPVFALIAAAIKLESRGPVFYRQVRIGKDGLPFLLYKFRKMRHGLEVGPKISPRNDLRLTRVGHLLERWKLDELPQLINVLRGEMRIIGPRPEVPEIVALYTPRQRRVLRAWPGITGPCQIRWRNEKELIPPDIEDVESYYVRFILPEKLETDLEYLRRRTWWTDIQLLAQTVWVTLFEPLQPKYLARRLNFAAHLATDALLLGAAAVAASSLLAPLERLEEQLRIRLPVALVLAAAHYLGFLISGVSYQSWRLVGKSDLLQLAASLLGSSLVAAPVALLWLPDWWDGARLLVLSYTWTMLLAGGGRFALAIHEERRHKTSSSAPPVDVVLYGVNRESEFFLRRVELGLEPGVRVLGFLDNDIRKKGMRIRKVKVLGTAADLSLLHSLRKIAAVYVFTEPADPAFAQVRRQCSKLGIELRRGLPSTSPANRAPLPRSVGPFTPETGTSTFHSSEIGR